MECHSKWSLKHMLLLFTYLHILSNSIQTVLGGEKLALLSATLRTYQKVACDTDQILVTCPRGTSISIEFAQYNNNNNKDGISIEQLCLTKNDSNSGKVYLHLRTRAKHLLRGSIFALPTKKMSALRQNSSTKTPSSITSIIITTTAITKINESTVEHTLNNNNNNSTNNNNNNKKKNNTHISTEEPIAKSNNNNNNAINLEFPEHKTENCMWPNALQYSLLQTVVEACQKKKHCRFSGSAPYYSIGRSGVGDTSGTSSYNTSITKTNSSTTNNNNFSTNYNNSSSSNGSNYITGSGRPCPKQRKIVEIGYKCRPYEFRSKVACHNDVVQLECNPYSRIAVYSASFGRTEYESIQCPQPQGVREETCLASYATETVMQICHGRRRCNLAADANTFGTPCRPNSRMYLKVVYTCVPKQVLKERYESDVESDEPDGERSEINELYDDDLNYKESEAIPKLYSNTTAIIPATKSNSIEENSSFIFDINTETGGIHPVMTHSADLSVEDDRERLYLYVLICGSASIIITIVVIATRLVLQKRDILTANAHSSTSIKMTNTIVGASSSTGGLRCGLNISERNAETDANSNQTTTNNAISVASLIANENFATYGCKSNGNLNINNVYDIATPSTIHTFQGGVSASTGPPNSTKSMNPARISNPLLYGHRTSPDIIGISSSNAFMPAVNAAAITCNNSFTSVQAQKTVDDNQIELDSILSSGIDVGSSVVDTIGITCDGRVMGTLPLSALSQFTTAPSLRAGYIINSDVVLTTPPICISQQRSTMSPMRTPTPPKFSSSSTITAMTTTTSSLVAEDELIKTSNGGGGVAVTACHVFPSSLTQQQQQGILKPQIPTTYSNNPITATMQSATLRRNKVTFEQQQQLQQQNISYDGTAPRTHSTGVPINSKFYYG